MASTAETFMVGVMALVVMYLSMVLLQWRKLKLPPGPRPWPIIGSMHLLGTHPHRSLADLARTYGPVMSLWLGQRLCVVATSPEAAREFLKLQDANFSARPPSLATEIIAPKDIIFHDVTPVSRHLRKILVSELTSAKRLEASKYIRTEEMGAMLRSISKACATGPIKVHTHLHIMTTNILSRMIFCKRFLGAEDPQQADASEIQEFQDINEESSICFSTLRPQDFFDWVPQWFDPQGFNARYRRIRARRDAFYDIMIEQHKKYRGRNPISVEADKTLLDVLLEQLDVPENGVTEEHIRCALWNALAAGTSTSRQTSEWAMAEVLRNPAVMKEARLELDRVVGLDRIVQESDIPHLKYIQAIVKEVFRHRAPAPLLLPHQSISDTKVLGYDIPAKTRLIVNVWGIGRDPHVWEEPLEFVPSRFLAGAPHQGTEFQGQDFDLIPFGAGRRSCPGLMFGSIMVHLEVANLLHAFDWSLPSPENLDMMEGQGVVLPMVNPLAAIAKPRLPSHLY